MTENKNWIKVPDSQIQHVWKSGDDEVRVTPDWYEQNGTPINDEGEDYEYSHTEIVREKVVIEAFGGVAECTESPEHVEVEIIDHDNEKHQ
jgi:hypothetical protein